MNVSLYNYGLVDYKDLPVHVTVIIALNEVLQWFHCGYKFYFDILVKYL